jgi:hypothetical protein
MRSHFGSSCVRYSIRRPRAATCLCSMLMIAFLVFCCLMSGQIVLTVYTNHIRWIIMLVYAELHTVFLTLWAAWVAPDQAAAEEIIAAHMAAVGPIPPVVIVAVEPACLHMRRTRRGSTVGYIQIRCLGCREVLYRGLRPMEVE